MGDRDHSYECEVCGEDRGGLNDLSCACDREEAQPYEMAMHLNCLAANLTVAAGLCLAHKFGDEYARDVYWTGGKYAFKPGCGHPAPGWGNQ